MTSAAPLQTLNNSKSTTYLRQAPVSAAPMGGFQVFNEKTSFYSN
jgi:hypothetical protein